jgi:hypothetical protein
MVKAPFPELFQCFVHDGKPTKLYRLAKSYETVSHFQTLHKMDLCRRTPQKAMARDGSFASFLTDKPSYFCEDIRLEMNAGFEQRSNLPDVPTPSRKFGSEHQNSAGMKDLHTHQTERTEPSITSREF